MRENIKSRIFSILFYSIVLIIFDILFFICFKPSNINYFMIVSLDLAIGFLIAFLLSIGNKIYKTIILIISNFLLIFYCTFQIVIMALKKSLSGIFSFSTIVFNSLIVIQEYGDEFFDILKNNFFMLLMLILACIVIIYITKKIYIDSKISFNIITSIILLIISILLFVASSLFINRNVYDFESDMYANGLKVAVIHDMFKNYKVQIVKTTDDIKETLESETIETEMVEESNVENNNYDNKPYYYDTSKYNVINFDFDKLIENEKRSDYNAINEFIRDRKPTEKNEYTGIFKGKNLIMICAEAWNSNIVDPELFPAMHRLMNNGFKFNNFYQPHAASSTSSGEYSFMVGMIPVNNDRTFVNSLNNNMGFTISMKMKEDNYNTYSFHNGRSTFYGRDETHDSLMGFKKYMANDNGLNEYTESFYTDDTSLVKAAYEISSKEKPFLAYMMTYNGHKPYEGELIGNMNTYYSRVNIKHYNDYSDSVKYYMAKNMFLEKGLEYLLEKLEEDNLLDDTVICMVPDHYPYGLLDDSYKYLLELYKDDRVAKDITFRDRTDIILWSGSLENEYKSLVKPIDKVTCTIDLMPTLLNLFGFEFDSRLYPGRDCNLSKWNVY